MDAFTPFEPSNNSTIPSSSNTSGLFLPGHGHLLPQQFEAPEPLLVEKLQMADLMKNPIVQGLFSTVMENAAYQKKLFQQVNSLQAELASLKEVMSRRPTLEYCHLQNVSTESISPSDSISQRATDSLPSTSNVPLRQAPYRAGQATRPAQYPQSIIWNLEDCKLYPGIITETNLSRPAMEKCIRHEDGSEISSKEWHSIKASARLLVNIYLTTLKSPADPSAKTRTKTKTYYSKYFPQVWRDVLEKLEDSQPLVGFCASHWKAEHIIANCLQANIDYDKKKRKVNADPSPPSEGYGDGEQGGTDIIPAGSKRGSEEMGLEFPAKKKQKTKRSTTTTSMRQDKNTPPPISSAIGSASGVSFEKQLLSLGSIDPNRTQAPSSNVPQPQLETGNTIDISFIYVDTKCSSLKERTKPTLSDELAESFPLIQNAADLLDAMDSHPQFGGGNPSDNLVSFLMRIETADPNSTDFSEDDTNASWGHSQFTTGNLTWSTVLTSWSDVGNCGVACQLIAATIKTCKVARHLCFERQISPGSYLSDIYLEQIVGALWRLWMDAGGPIQKGKKAGNLAALPPTPALDSNRNEDSQEVPFRPTAEQNAGQPSDTSDTANTGPLLPGEGGTNSIAVRDQPSTNELNDDATAEALKELEKLLQSKNVVKDELKAWIKANNVAFTSTNKQPTKQDLVSAILKDPHCRTRPAALCLEFQKMVDERKECRKTLRPH